MSETYQPKLYVQREELFEQIREWIHLPADEYRLWSLVGAAGIGKSWFMTDTYQRLRKEGNCLPIWLDLSQGAIYPDLGASAPEAGQPFPDCQTPEGRSQWLEREITRAKKVCPRVSDYNPHVAFSVMLRKFVQDLCQLCARYIPVLLIDGYEEVGDEASKDFLQEHIFSNFFGGGCTRLMIARRDKDGFGFHPTLAYVDKVVPLPPFEESQSQEQITKRRREKAPAAIGIDQHVTPYLTGNPFINVQLFERAAINDPSSLGSYDFQVCLTAVLDRAGLGANHAGLLQHIARISLEWTKIELRDVCYISIDHPEMEDLFQAGLVYHVEGTGGRYKIDDGLHQLLSFL